MLRHANGCRLKPCNNEAVTVQEVAREAGGLSLEPGFVSSLLLLKPQTQRHTDREGSVCLCLRVLKHMCRYVLPLVFSVFTCTTRITAADVFIVLN